MTIYSRFEARAREMLTKYGSQAAITSTSGAFNPATGAIDGTETDIVYGFGLIGHYRRDEIDGVNVLSSDVKIYLENVTSVNIGDSISIGVNTHRVINMQLIDPTGNENVMYIVQGRA